mmetsp:Transcript_10399/g.13930  ORF Transcript_10399/g.13930 Transcript_10399/m.13930 type:complete len:277 (+) Transcript_10399:204-1034(+)
MFTSNALMINRVNPFHFSDTEQDDDYGFFLDEDVDSDCDSLSSDHDTSDLDALAAQLPNEPSESLRSSPPILSVFMVEQISNLGLPSSLQDHMWNRLYSSSRDGDSFGTFMRKVRGFSCTLVVAMTSRGEIMGGFTTAPWSGRKKEQGTSSSESFLFKVGLSAKEQSCFIPGFEPYGKSPTTTVLGAHHGPSLSSICSEEYVSVYRCQEADQYTQTCHIGNKRLTIGGKDGSLGFCVSDCFSRGCTSPCDVYGTSSPLASSENFDIVEFEVYGFSI